MLGQIHPEKAKGPTVAAVSPLKTGQSDGNFNARSTKTEAQRLRILEALRQRPQTTEDLRKLGSFQCATRIFELRAMGWNIETSRLTVVDREGYYHARAALYSLIEGEKVAS